MNDELTKSCQLSSVPNQAVGRSFVYSEERVILFLPSSAKDFVHLRFHRNPSWLCRSCSVRSQLQDRQAAYRWEVAIIREKGGTASSQSGHKLKRVRRLDSRCGS